ncbi:hypothetical protein AC578_3193 [Pseudocercospora eumusae]|uniref:DNA replication complex GINS protein PSF3 n=1 Tax=Pseudocercospora eumusae TaxID=321146 RepID=A0A139H5P6_9PEZI|nr:hypothetical protein AC578_3193 [Pseudocercospora eumusae]
MASYYDIDAILTDSQKAPCTFELDVPQLAPLNNASAIESGSKLDLPLWLGEMLAVSKPAGPSSDSLASLHMPHALNQHVVHALSAEPTSVDIRERATYFFRLAERMLELFDDEHLIATLLDTFKKRALQIADNAQNSRAPTKDDPFMRGLDDSERQLFRSVNEGRIAVKKWENDTKT